MQTKEKKALELLRKYDEERYNSLSPYLANPTPAGIKEYTIRLLVSGKLSEVDQSNIRGFLGIKQSDDLLKSIKQNTESFKPLQYFFLRKTKQTTKSLLLEVAEILIRTEDEVDTKKVVKEENDSLEKNKGEESEKYNASSNVITREKKSRIPFFAFLSFCIVAITIASFYFFNEKSSIPTTQIEKQKIDEVSNGESTRKDIKTIINTTIVNSPDQKELSIFIFDDKGILDNDLTSYLASQFDSSYQITAPLINSKDLDEDVVKKLQSANFQSFGVPLSDHIDALCIGTVKYQFRENTIMESLTNCDMTVRFRLYDVKTGKLIDSFSHTTTGNGSSEENVKYNTIQKLQL